MQTNLSIDLAALNDNHLANSTCQHLLADEGKPAGQDWSTQNQMT